VIGRVCQDYAYAKPPNKGRRAKRKKKKKKKAKTWFCGGTELAAYKYPVFPPRRVYL